MHDPAFMGVVNGNRECANQLGRITRRLGLALEAIGERTTLDQFQRKERLAIVLADFKDLDNVGVLKLRSRRCLGPEASELIGTSVAGAKDDFERYQPIERFLPSLVNDPHAATAEFGNDLKAEGGKVCGRLTGRGVLRTGPSQRRGGVGGTEINCGSVGRLGHEDDYGWECMRVEGLPNCNCFAASALTTIEQQPIQFTGWVQSCRFWWPGRALATSLSQRSNVTHRR